MHSIRYQMPNSSNPSLVTYSFLFLVNYIFPQSCTNLSHQSQTPAKCQSTQNLGAGKN